MLEVRRDRRRIWREEGRRGGETRSSEAACHLSVEGSHQRAAEFHARRRSLHILRSDHEPGKGKYSCKDVHLLKLKKNLDVCIIVSLKNDVSMTTAAAETVTTKQIRLKQNRQKY